ncbi:unnamed protein product [Protopolystoma xenopodis]|uniref:Integrin alpha-2 domain-containing protein n=1 Tax=Protopolystoma xenopodis TaxID=117903 RepID=A0A448WJ57_9PLAT|nr:unnamed protein product [Protopolystoma xenopodis]
MTLCTRALALLCLATCSVSTHLLPGFWSPHSDALSTEALDAVPPRGGFRGVATPDFTRDIDFARLIAARLRRQAPDAASSAVAAAFKWSTVTAFHMKRGDGPVEAWLVVGGAAPRGRLASAGLAEAHAFATLAGGLVACRLRAEPGAPAGFALAGGADACEALEAGWTGGNSTEAAGLLGPTGLDSLQLPAASAPAGAEAVLVYCDPLWHSRARIGPSAAEPGQVQPSGRCRVRLRQEVGWTTPPGHGEADGYLNFCSAGAGTGAGAGGGARPCGAGYAVQLRLAPEESVGTDVGLRPNVHLLVGMPFAQPTGRVQLLGDLLGATGLLAELVGRTAGFGSSLAWMASEPLALVSAPLPTGELAASLTGFRVYSEAAGASRPAAFHVAAEPGEFAGFGLAIAALRPGPQDSPADGLAEVRPTAVPASRHPPGDCTVIGSPYFSPPQLGANTGRVQLYCPGAGGRLDSVTGSRPGELFGYSVARVGDVDGDGIEDFAVGAPALGEHVGSSSCLGRVYIFRVTRDYRIEKKAFQVRASDGFKMKSLFHRPLGFSCCSALIGITHPASRDYHWTLVPLLATFTFRREMALFSALSCAVPVAWHSSCAGILHISFKMVKDW